MSPSTLPDHDGAGGPSREARITAALIDLADTLVADFDPADFLYRVTEHCMNLLDIGDAGVMLAVGTGPLRLVAATSESVRLVELFELDAKEGPCFTAFHTATPVEHTLLTSPSPLWPRFSARARRSGYAFVYAAPVLLRSQTIGVLNLFRRDPGPMSEADRSLARALADVTAISLLQQTALDHHRTVQSQLQQALDTRTIIEQAKGFLAARHGIDPDTAFQRMRAHARHQQIRIANLARAILDEVETLPPPIDDTGS
ncbi:RNA-binding protein [Streptomyces sp. WAC 01529]|uniref:GAF and ANTAR domain-containing protein n=1 Tax=Streptomyces sp. WAC 01529 TaxID=2203205 RepID=UPI000F6B56CE|nr:GAF and ANTAR domain-containing protein [Streptomyces sp. WAC 01529]AZM51745.1 RNA-binding protein [Streptomyces sp. WAC 01529]